MKIHSDPMSIRIAAIFILVGACCAVVIPVPIAKKGILGAWSGFTSDANHFYRVVLREQDGWIGASFVGSEPRIYRIDSWGINSKGELRMSVASVSTNAYAILIRANAKTFCIDLEVGPKDDGWKHNIALYRESLIEKQLNELKQCMKNL